MTNLTPGEIKSRIEAAFQPHRTVVQIEDFNARIGFEVQAENGHVLAFETDWLVREIKHLNSLTERLRMIKEQVDRKVSQPVGLDDPIRVGGQKTTIREEYAAQRVKGMRGTESGLKPFGHWAVINGQSFPVSEQDHALLRGERETAREVM